MYRQLPIVTKIRNSSVSDLEFTATLIDALYFNPDFGENNLIQSKYTNNAISIVVDGDFVDLNFLVNLYEDESIHFISIPPYNYFFDEFNILFNNYINHRKIYIAPFKEDIEMGIIQLNTKLTSKGLISDTNIYNKKELKERSHIGIMNLTRNFHFITNKKQLGTLYYQ